MSTNTIISPKNTRSSPPRVSPGLLYSPGYSGSCSLRSRMVTVEKREVREAAGSLRGRGGPRSWGEGDALTNGPGCGPNARQEQEGPHSESCHLGCGATWCSPATCNRHQAGATARLVLSTAGVGHWASTLPGNAGYLIRPGPVVLQLPGLSSWQGYPSPVAWTARCPAPQGFQLGRGAWLGLATSLPPPWCWRLLLSNDKAGHSGLSLVCFLPACPQTLSLPC